MEGKKFWTGLLAGFAISILTSIVTNWIQHTYTRKEMALQLYLDEKKEFANACDDFLKQYRNWHELMNYFQTEGSSESVTSLNFANKEEAEKAYTQWKRDFDFAYGRLFILSDNEFGYKTLEVSTVLHGALDDAIGNGKNQLQLYDIDSYFFESWMMKAQEEIFRYNSGMRKQKSIKEFINDQKKLREKDALNDSLNTQLYERLIKSGEAINRRDSMSGRKGNFRVPTKEEFNELVKPENEQ